MDARTRVPANLRRRGCWSSGAAFAGERGGEGGGEMRLGFGFWFGVGFVPGGIKRKR
jgi:hypothetical protein